jgi:hypothetical protein
MNSRRRIALSPAAAAAPMRLNSLQSEQQFLQAIQATILRRKANLPGHPNGRAEGHHDRSGAMISNLIQVKNERCHRMTAMKLTRYSR